jgi:hypothetical protein
VTEHGVMDGTFIHGARPVVLHAGVRLLLTVLVFAGGSSLAAVFAGRESRRDETALAFSWRSTLILVVPFLLVYCCLLIPRGLAGDVFDRYLLPILFVLALVLGKYYQGARGRQLPGYSVALLLVIAAYSVAATHDAFAMLQGRLDAAEEVRSAGVPAGAIDAGWEYNSWTELQMVGHLQSRGMRVHGGVEMPDDPEFPQLTCRPQMWNHAPALRPQYALSFDPDECSGRSAFQPVTYHEWLPPRAVTLYVVKVAPGPTNDIEHY